MHRQIFWRQGMLLKPQHFQYADWVNQSNQWKVWQRLQRHSWGLTSCEIDPSLLNNGVVTFTALEAIFPDGSWVKKDVNAVIVPCSFSKENLFAKSTFMVYAGIRKLLPDQVNAILATDQPGAEDNVRFITHPQGEEVNNLYEKDVSANVQTLRYVIRLFTNENIAEMTDYIVVPVASLSRSETGDVHTNEAYIPPVVSIESSPQIMDCLVSVYGNIKRSLNQLESYKFGDASDSVSGAEALNYMAPILIKYRFALQVLSRYFMEFRHLIAEPTSHPRVAFLLFQSFIAEMTAFTPKVSVLSAEVDDHALSMSYDHFDMGPLFTQSVRLAKTLLDEIVVSEDLNVSSERESEDTFSVVIPEKFFRLNNRFYLVVVTSEDPKSWLQDFLSFSRVASSHRLKELVRRSLPGLRFSHSSETPPGLPSRQNAHYFLVDQTGGIWEDIYNSRSLAISWDGAPENARIDLSVVEG